MPLFPESLRKLPKGRLTGKGIYHIRGKLAGEVGMYRIEVVWIQKVC